MSKSILFYVDQKHRDLPALSLIGYYLRNIGYKVGYEPLWNWKVANYFDIIVINKPAFKEIEKWVKKKIVIIIETEGANQDISFKRTIQYYPHLYFFWSKTECEKYEKELTHNNTQYSIKGYPRLDLFYSPLKDLNGTKYLGKQKRLTIATSTQEAHFDDKHLREVLSRRKKDFDDSVDYMLNAKNCKILLNKTTDLIEFILKNYKDYKIYLKPHPNENIVFWKKYISKLNNENIQLFIGKPINDLLKISEMHIAHNACTTIFEANLMNIPTVEILTEYSNQLIAADHLKISKYKIFDNEDFIKVMNSEANSLQNHQNQYSNNFKKYINKYFYKFDGKRCLSYAREIDSFINKNGSIIKVSTLNKIIRYLYFYLFSFKSLLIRNNDYFIDQKGRYDNRINNRDHLKWFSLFNELNINNNKI